MMRVICTVSILFVVLMGTAYADRSTLDDTKTQVALPLSTPPTIDGVIDAAEWTEAAGAVPGGADSYWLFQYDENLEDFVRGASNPTTSTGGPFDANDIAVRIWVGYDSQNLYVAVRVTDDVPSDDSAAAGSKNGNTWEDDSVEVFVDGDNSNFATRDTTGTNPEIVNSGGQYVITYNNAYREAEAGNPGYGETQAWYALTGVTDTGFEAEFRISMSDLGNPQAGDIIGFTIAVNDDDDGATLENQYTWVGATHEEATYGNLILGPRKYTAPKVTTAPTVDGTINAGEYGSAATISVNSFTGDYDVRSGDDTWLDGDHSYQAWVVHDNEAIYVALDVTDDIVSTDTAAAGSEDGSTWEDDAVEVLFDADNSNDSGRSTTNLYEGQFVLTANGAWRDAEANNPLFGADLDWFAATTATAKGYQQEYKILKATILDPADGATLGFNLTQNDDDGAGRKAQLSWNGVPHNEVSYGDLILAASGGTDVMLWALY